MALARHEAAQGRRVLIGTYKPVADLLRAELARRPSIERRALRLRSVVSTAGRTSTP